MQPHEYAGGAFAAEAPDARRQRREYSSVAGLGSGPVLAGDVARASAAEHRVQRGDAKTFASMIPGYHKSTYEVTYQPGGKTRAPMPHSDGRGSGDRR